MKTVVHKCPKCDIDNTFNVKTSIKERDVNWFQCSFCFKRSDKTQWDSYPTSV